MIKNAQEKIVLADSTKCEAIFPSVFSDGSDLDRLITDIDAPESFVEGFVAHGVEVMLA